MSDTMTMSTLRDEEQRIILERLRAKREFEDAKRAKDAGSADPEERRALRSVVKSTLAALDKNEADLADVRARIELEEAIARKPGIEKILRQAKALGQQRLKIVGRVDAALADLHTGLLELAQNGEEISALSREHKDPQSLPEAFVRPMHTNEVQRRFEDPLAAALPGPYSALYPGSARGWKESRLAVKETRAVDGIVRVIERDLAEIDRIEKESF